MTRLKNRVAVVTGAAKGLGHSYALALAQAEANVVIADIVDCQQRLKEWPDELRERVSFQKTDVTSYDEVSTMVAHALAEYGRIDILINNAALFTGLAREPFYELGSEEWERVLAVNVIGVFHCIRAVFPIMKEQNYGKIINISSDAIFKGLPNLLHYVTSKGAILAMTRALAKELGPYNITVNAIAPGYTPHEDVADDERNAQVIRLRALQRTQTPDDLLGAILFFASSDSDFVTGQTLVVDGGEVFH